MRMNKVSKLATLAMTGGFVLAGGCSFDSLGRNVWRGFGYALGGIPANIVSDLIVTNFLGGIIPGTGDDAEDQ